MLSNMFAKVVLLSLVGQAVWAQDPLYTAFVTYPQPDRNAVYQTLYLYTSISKVLIKFPDEDLDADYTTQTWLDPCYEEFYSNPENLYVIFWMVDNSVYCEALAKTKKATTPRYPVENLMRVEILGDRCA